MSADRDFGGELFQDPKKRMGGRVKGSLRRQLPEGLENSAPAFQPGK